MDAVTEVIGFIAFFDCRTLFDFIELDWQNI